MKQFTKRFAVLCLSVLLVLVTIEISFWVYAADRDIPWGPGVKWYQEKYYELNTKGFRDRERKLEKPTDTFRVVVLGDSFSFPANLKLLENGYVYQLEQQLTTRGGVQHIEVINLAKTGFNTQDEFEMLLSTGFAYQPDLVLVGYVLNDADQNAAPSHLVPPLGNSLSEELKHGTQAIQKVLVEGNREWLRSYFKLRSYVYSFLDIRIGMLSSQLGNGNNWFEQATKRLYKPQNFSKQEENLKRLVQETRERGVKVGIVLFPYFYHLKSTPFAKEHAVVREAAQQAGVSVLDLYPAFSPIDEKDLVLGWWDPHPNEKAHTMAADAIANWLIREKLIPFE